MAVHFLQYIPGKQVLTVENYLYQDSNLTTCHCYHLTFQFSTTSARKVLRLPTITARDFSAQTFHHHDILACPGFGPVGFPAHGH